LGHCRDLRESRPARLLQGFFKASSRLLQGFFKASSKGQGIDMRHDNEGSAKVQRFVTAGVEIERQTVKMALLAHGPTPALVLASEAVVVGGRRGARDAQIAVKQGWNRALRSAGLLPADIALIASTGAEAQGLVRVGHLYRRSSLAAGVRFLFPDAAAVLEVGASQMRCVCLDRSRAKGAGKMRDAVAPAGGDGDVSPDVAWLPGRVAALEEIAARASLLMRGLAVAGPTAVTGARAIDAGFVRALARRLVDDGLDVTLLASPDAIFAGAYGAALRAADRFRRVLGWHLSRRSRSAPSSPWRRARSLLN
jgi:benzoyl-CoA reductase subunit D